MEKRTDVNHVTDYLQTQSRHNLIYEIDHALNDAPPGTYDNVKDQYIGTTRDVLLALASGFPESSPWNNELQYFIGLADREFADLDTDTPQKANKVKGAK